MTFGGAVFDFLTLFSFCLFTNKKGGKFQILLSKLIYFLKNQFKKSILISRYYYIYYTEILYGLPEQLRVCLLAKKITQCVVVSLDYLGTLFMALHSLADLIIQGGTISICLG